MVEQRGAGERLGTVDGGLFRQAAVGGLLGGLLLFLLLASYEATQHLGFASLLNFCFAAFVFKSARTAPMGSIGRAPMATHTAMPMATHSAAGMMQTGGMGGMMTGPIVASHVVVGGLLHAAMSIGAAVAFVLVLTIAIRAGLRLLSRPLAYVGAATIGGALLYVIMMYGVAPWLNTTITHFTPRVPFFLAHLVFGATVGGFVYWRRAYAATRHATVGTGELGYVGA